MIIKSESGLIKKQTCRHSIKNIHSQDAVDSYIKHFEQIKKLLKKGLDEKAIVSITGRILNVVRRYTKLYKNFNTQKSKISQGTNVPIVSKLHISFLM